MRKVLFKKWNKHQYEKVEGVSKLIIGTGKWDDDFIHYGIFHQWGLESVEVGETIASHTVGIVECEDGVVEGVLICNIKFI
jgi:hypothetical protein